MRPTGHLDGPRPRHWDSLGGPHAAACPGTGEDADAPACRPRPTPSQAHTVPGPQLKVVVAGSARRNILGEMPPLALCRALLRRSPSAQALLAREAAGFQDIQDPVQDGPDIDTALSATRPRGRDQRGNLGPFLIGQIARLAQAGSTIPCPVLRGPPLSLPRQPVPPTRQY